MARSGRRRCDAIGMMILRADTLWEPMCRRSREDLVRYTDVSIPLSASVPGSAASQVAIAQGEILDRRSGTGRRGARRPSRDSPHGSTSRV